jgi:hypothetical protein
MLQHIEAKDRIEGAIFEGKRSQAGLFDVRRPIVDVDAGDIASASAVAIDQDALTGSHVQHPRLLRKSGDELIDKGYFSSIDGGIAPIRVEATVVITAALVFAKSFLSRH